MKGLSSRPFNESVVLRGRKRGRRGTQQFDFSKLPVIKS
jgi:hypothetical protein